MTRPYEEPIEILVNVVVQDALEYTFQVINGMCYDAQGNPLEVQYDVVNTLCHRIIDDVLDNNEIEPQRVQFTNLKQINNIIARTQLTVGSSDTIGTTDLIQEDPLTGDMSVTISN